MSLSNHVLNGVQILKEGAFLGLSGPFESIGYFAAKGIISPSFVNTAKSITDGSLDNGQSTFQAATFLFQVTLSFKIMFFICD